MLLFSSFMASTSFFQDRFQKRLPLKPLIPIKTSPQAGDKQSPLQVRSCHAKLTRVWFYDLLPGFLRSCDLSPQRCDRKRCGGLVQCLWCTQTYNKFVRTKMRLICQICQICQICPFQRSEKNWRPTDRRINRPTDRPTDRPMDGRTDLLIEMRGRI